MVTAAPPRLAIIDDSPDNRQALMGLAKQAGYLPYEVEDALPLDDLVERVMENANAALTDLRLSESWNVPYNGAQLAARLFTLRLPTILVSEYANDDADTVIRLHRKNLPEVLRADAVTSAAELRVPLRHCSEELDGRVPVHRRAWRALARVTARYSARGEALIEVVVPEWDSLTPVRLPVDLIPSEHHHRLVSGFRFFSRINTDARTAEEVFFDGFEPAPEVSA